MVLPDLRGKGGRVRTVAIPIWVKHGIDAWIVEAKIEAGRLLRPLSKSGKLIGDELGDWAVWSVVEQSAKEIGIERFGAHDLRRTCAKLCRKNGGDLQQIKFLFGHSSIQTTERYLGSEQELSTAVTIILGFKKSEWLGVHSLPRGFECHLGSSPSRELTTILCKFGRVGRDAARACRTLEVTETSKVKLSAWWRRAKPHRPRIADLERLLGRKQLKLDLSTEPSGKSGKRGESY